VDLDIMMSGCKNHDVRTTLTLEDDVSARLRLEIRRTGKPLKQVVNEYLRFAFERGQSAKPAKKFKVRPFQAGPPPGMTFDNVEELLEYIEGPSRR
jgi:hypothetical protein